MNDESGSRREPFQFFQALIRWVDSYHGIEEIDDKTADEKTVDWLRVLPFIVLHLACLGVIWVGWSPIAVIVAAGLYVVRMFAITGFYHRYFSHKAFQTGRFWQFVFAALGNSSAQRGPIWWASHHRHHHRFTDQPEDVHSPLQHGFWWSHMGWLTSRKNFPTQFKYVGDWMKFPELVWVDRFDTFFPLMLALALFFAGTLLDKFAPGLNTDGWQMLVWGFFISTVFLFHGTVTINSFAHIIGRRRFDTPDTSRNSFLLSIITLGEGWHNNHHHYPVCARQGFRWWEIDVTYYVLKLMAWLGIVKNLRPLPDKMRFS
jgi:stearoyl-CoA desaturase (delta-9 desaturase)